MSSATSTKDDAGFKPWHFFVLASLTAATAAVLMSRQSSPEHLVLISFTIGAAGAASAACYRMLAPLAARDVSLLHDRRSERARALIEREKALVLRSIKELEFDRAMGKVSPKDFDEMAGRLRARAIMLMKQVDAGNFGYRELIERDLSARLATLRLKPEATEPGGVRLQADRDEVRLKPEATEAGTSTASHAPDAANPCAGCGTSNDPDAAFCKRCGTKLEAAHS